jgi:hypothetical protein
VKSTDLPSANAGRSRTDTSAPAGAEEPLASPAPSDRVWRHVGGPGADRRARPEYALPAISAQRLRSLASALLTVQIRSGQALPGHEPPTASSVAGRSAAAATGASA